MKDFLFFRRPKDMPGSIIPIAEGQSRPAETDSAGGFFSGVWDG
jgi:hypothetical protein